MLIGLLSAKGSPGVTTSALVLAAEWPQPALLLDADPFGGDVRAGIGCGSWPPGSGLTELVVDLRSGPFDEALSRRVHRPVPYAPSVLAGLGSVGQAASVPWDRLGSALAYLPGVDVVADCGRFAVSDGVVPLLRACDALVVVSGSDLRAARSTARLAPLLWEELSVPPGDPRVSALIVRPDRPYSSEEIAEGCRLPLLGELPDDPRSAAVWSDGARPGRAFARSPLQREARRIAERIAAHSTNGRGVA